MSDMPAERSTVEATGKGETAGEAKWAALRELESRVPGLVKEAVEYEVVSEGERGLLGVGFVEATVIARVSVPRTEPVATQPEAAPAASPPLAEPETNEELVAEVLGQICDGLGVKCDVRVTGNEEGYQATIEGDDLGAVIGRRGQIIDAIQQLAQSVLGRHAGLRIPLSVDAAGYRARRGEVLVGIAEQAASEAIESGMEIQLEPMSATERKVIHLHLQDREDIETLSEGADPNRFVVVRTHEPPA